MLSVLTIMIFYKEKINWLMMLLFIFTQSTFLQFWTPEFLRNYGSGTPNGSLWTICIFVQFYLAAYFLHKILKNKQPAVWFLTIGGFLLSDIMYPAWGGVIKNEILYKLCGQTLLPYLYLFLTGSFLSCFYRQMIPVLKKTWWIFLAGDMFFTMSGYDLPGRYSPFRTICLILAVIGIAYRINIKINYDISYEIYIFHGIILNLLLELGLYGNMLYFFITIAACILLSAGAYELKKRLVRG